MNENKKKWKNWAAAAFLAAVITGLVTAYECSAYGISTINAIHFLCDGFFVSGLLFLCFGTLLWIAGLGGFSGIAYLFYSLGAIFTPKKSRFEERKSYYDFLREKETREKSKNRPLFCIGGVCILISLFLVVLFELYETGGSL